MDLVEAATLTSSPDFESFVYKSTCSTCYFEHNLLQSGLSAVPVHPSSVRPLISFFKLLSATGRGGFTNLEAS